MRLSPQYGYANHGNSRLGPSPPRNETAGPDWAEPWPPALQTEEDGHQPGREGDPGELQLARRREDLPRYQGRGLQRARAGPGLETARHIEKRAIVGESRDNTCMIRSYSCFCAGLITLAVQEAVCSL